MATHWVLRGPVGRDDAPRLVAELTELLAGRTVTEPGDAEVRCDVGGIVNPDLATIDVLARLQMAARRLGHRLVLVGGGPRLRELIVFAGLHGILSAL